MHYRSWAGWVLIAVLVVYAGACDKPATQQVVKQPPAPAAPELQPDPPANQEVSVNLIYAGEAEDAGKVGFDFRVLSGNWKSNKKTLEMASHAPVSSKLDLGCVTAKVQPVFPGGRQCQYVVKIMDREGALMGDFRIVGTGKQVKLADTATPGYSSTFVYFDPSRYITAYSLQQRKGKKLGPKVGVLFVGEGWEAVDAAKAHTVSGKFEFPKVDMVILPAEWMDENEINLTFRTLKRGTATAAGVCYS
jgi:hypothetical protein